MSMHVVEDAEKLCESPKVSVLCATFNQRDYIGQAIESFLAQKTDFDYEILVNDDCSTDGTTKIVLNYQCKYPNLIRVITHDENQYSKGQTAPVGEILLPKARGQYVALCEGDDFWCDTAKLQFQYDFMEAHPEVAVCVHANNHVHASTGRVVKTVRYADHDCMVTPADALSHVQCYATNSMFIRTQALRDFRRSEFTKIKVDGDHRMLVYFSLVAGGIYYQNRVMSAYRMMAKGSANSRMVSAASAECVAAAKHDQRVALIRFADEYTHGRYHEEALAGAETMDYVFYRECRDMRTLRRRWPERLRREGILAHLDMGLYTYCRPLHALALKIWRG